jgi:hypothetical protein
MQIKPYGETDGDFLCIGCLEKRIGRRLVPQDFMAVPINDHDDAWKTPRLAERLRPNHIDRNPTMSEEKITGMYELVDAIEAAINASDPAKREALALTIDAYAEDFPEEFFWIIGPQAPSLLHLLFTTIDSACRPPSQSKPRPVIRLVDRKPEGSA